MKKAQTTIARIFRGGRARSRHMNPSIPEERNRALRMIMRNTPWMNVREKKAYGSAIRSMIPYGPPRASLEYRARTNLCKAMGKGRST